MTSAVSEELAPDLDGALRDLDSARRVWAATSHQERAHLLHQVAEATLAEAPAWVAAACRAKQIAPTSSLAGEEWLSGPYPVAMNAATLARSVEAIARGASPIEAAKIGSVDGRTFADVFPVSVWDRLLLSGFSARVRFREGVTPAQVQRDAGLAQLAGTEPAGISVVLGAGNITSIAVLDTLYEVVANNRLVILKLNPVMAEMLASTRAVLKPLVDLGVVRVVAGGADVGKYLVDHELVDHVHITGSSTSHDMIVFGAGEEGERRHAAGDPLLTKGITSELGGVSPTIVVPGRWSKRDIVFQADHVATQRLHNGGYNCIASQVVVVPESWDQKEEFLAALAEKVDAAPARPAYYPGSDDRVASALAEHSGSEPRSAGRLMITRLRPDDAAAVFRTEYFAPVLAVVEVPGSGQDYLDAAAGFVNSSLAGTLGANVLVHPSQRKRLGRRFESFLGSLRYGTVAVNAWTAVGYLTATAPWGAYPGATLTAVESGIGVVHNALLLADTEQTVVQGPFRPFPRSVLTGQLSITPKPAWFVSNRTAGTTGRLLVSFIASPRWRSLPRLFLSALRG